MTKHYHIITCDNMDLLKTFINRGKVGVRPVVGRTVNSAVRMNWDILADIARVKKGDYILLHTEGIIKGLFEATNDPLIDSKDIQFFDGPDINTQNWKKNWVHIQKTIRQQRQVWWIPMRLLPERYFKKMKMDIIFDRIAREEITSLPQRLRYEDKNKTVKGLTKRDFTRIIYLFHNYSSSDTRNTTQSQQTQSPPVMHPINFDYLTVDAYEKNLEAIVVHRIRSETMTIIDYPRFAHSNLLNTVPLGYLKMADFLTWDEVNGEIINPWVWELKRGSFNNYDGLQEEIRKLSMRASYAENLLDNKYKITGVILACDFSPGAVRNFEKITLPVGPLEEIILVSYDGAGANINFNLVAKRGY